MIFMIAVICVIIVFTNINWENSEAIHRFPLSLISLMFFIQRQTLLAGVG
jgi:hypothetical protein